MDEPNSEQPTQVHNSVDTNSIDLPEYQVFEQIGAGGMARVYRAVHRPLEREVALKVLLPEYSEDPSFSERFMREARIAASLVHPHIVQIYDVDQYDQQLYLAMECVKGGDLSEKLDAGLSAKALMKATEELCEALDFAHQEGYIHRDIKPANILFRRDGSLVLSDFGIARSMSTDTQLTQVGMIIGTPTFMSPEQAQGKELTASSDLYSVGVLLFNLITGSAPYRSESAIEVMNQHISAPIPDLPKTLPHLQVFFNRALAKDPDDRYASGKKLFEALTLAFDHADDLIGIRKQFTAQMQKVDKPKQKPVRASVDRKNEKPRPAKSQSTIDRSAPTEARPIVNDTSRLRDSKRTHGLDKHRSTIVKIALVALFLVMCISVFVIVVKPNDSQLPASTITRFDEDHFTELAQRAYKNYQRASELKAELDRLVRRKMALGNTGDLDVDYIINATIKSNHSEVEYLEKRILADVSRLDDHWIFSSRKSKNALSDIEKTAKNTGKLKQVEWLRGLRQVLRSAPEEQEARRLAIEKFLDFHEE